MSYFVYVLISETHNTRYVGSCKDVQKRLDEHNTGRCRYTSGRIPWRLILQEEFPTLSEARNREFFLKSGQGRKELDLLRRRTRPSAGNPDTLGDGAPAADQPGLRMTDSSIARSSGRKQV